MREYFVHRHPPIRNRICFLLSFFLLQLVQLEEIENLLMADENAPRWSHNEIVRILETQGVAYQKALPVSRKQQAPVPRKKGGGYAKR